MVRGLKIFIMKIIGKENSIRKYSELPFEIILGPISQKSRIKIVWIIVMSSS
jgi:hypothetical protein